MNSPGENIRSAGAVPSEFAPPQEVHDLPAVFSRREFIRIATFLSLCPLLVLASFYLVVVLARIDLGHWPVFNDPLSKLVPGKFQRLGVGLGLMASPFMTLAAVVVAFAGRWRYRDFPVWKLLVFAVSAVALLGIVLQFDPGGFMNWFVD